MRLVSGGYDAVLRVWNPTTGQLEKERRVIVEISSICWSPDGSQIAGASSDNNVYIWDALPGLPVHRLSGHTTYVHSVSWSPNGKRIASADESGNIRVWDARTGQQTLTLPYPSGVPMVAWNPNGKSLACVGFGGTAAVHIWGATVDRSNRVFW